MAITDLLASSLGRKDEGPNLTLAATIARKKDAKAVAALVQIALKEKLSLRSDAIKVLSEIGTTNAALIAPHGRTFLALLDDKNNRIVWGAMTALDSISTIAPKEVYAHLPKILDTAAHGSVITRDHAVNILINLVQVKKFAVDALALLLAEIASCPVNQLPMYAERALPAMTKKMLPEFVRVLEERMKDDIPDSKRKRLSKVLKEGK